MQLTNKGKVMAEEQVNQEVTEDTTSETFVEQTNMFDFGEETNSGEYRGSKELNPEQRPLKLVNMDKMSKEEIDRQIDFDPTVVMTDEEIKELAKLEAEENTEEDGQTADDNTQETSEDTVEENVDENTEEDQEGTTESEIAPEITAFYDSTGLSKDEFASLSEVAQEKIFDIYSNQTKQVDTSELEKVKNEYYNYKMQNDKLLQDPIISARIKEHQTGQAYIPKTVPKLTEDESRSIEDAETIEDRDKVINEILQKRIDPYVTNLYQAKEQEHENKILQRKSFDIFEEIGQLDPEFKFNEKISDAIDVNHPMYNDLVNSNIGKLIQHLINTGENYSTISKKNPKAILAAYNAVTGRDQERDKKIASNAKKEILKELRNPGKATDGKPKARTAKTSGTKGHSQHGAGSTSREGLIQKMLDGDMQSFNVLGDRYFGDPQKTAELTEVYNEYLRRKKIT